MGAISSVRAGPETSHRDLGHRESERAASRDAAATLVMGGAHTTCFKVRRCVAVAHRERGSAGSPREVWIQTAGSDTRYAR
jgi:hypothetical protein